jgi:hypothetical protein
MLLPAANNHFTISNGAVIHIDEAGRRHRIVVGKECADLWVAPDESAIAFIAIDKTEQSRASLAHVGVQ